MQSRKDSFDEIVLDVADRARRYLTTRYAAVEFAVEDVPRSDPAPWEEQVAPVGKLLAVGGSVGHRIVIYRRPIEARARDSSEIAAIVGDVIAEQIAGLLGVPVDEINL